MESAQALKLAEHAARRTAIQHWLESVSGVHPITLHPMIGDASTRRYFRVDVRGASFVVMDAPPEHENCHAFVAIAKALREVGLNTPDILESDLTQGFLLLTDFGESTYLSSLNAQNADHLYDKALDALAVLQSCDFVNDHAIPPFTANFIQKEWSWHKEWFLEKFLGLAISDIENDLDRSYNQIVTAVMSQPHVFMHRDYHSANLMVLDENEVGILDFQDAFIGPVTYDLVSLLRDCYIAWPKDRVHGWVKSYHQKLIAQGMLENVSDEEFLRWFDWMGMQRHLKALLTFSRKHVRDQQSQYLRFVPRTLHYLLMVSEQYPELIILHDFLRLTVKPAVERNLLCAL